MTLPDFQAVTAERIPTPNEFIAFAEGMGWTFGDQSTVTVHVRRLREKIEADPAEPRRI